MVAIEKGVTPPAGKGHKGYCTAMRTMEIGDSFTAPESSRASFCSVGKRLGIKVTVRKVEPGVVRVWRIA